MPGAAMMDPIDARAVLAAATDSLRDIHSLRDFLVAVQVGSQTAITMLDGMERALLTILKTVNEDAPEA
jgi:hypothetical protein